MSKKSLDSCKNEYLETPLDPLLLKTPFKLQTNWYVITGSSCSGKSTLINQLADKGYQTIPEVGRQYIEKELAKGKRIDEIRKDRAELTRQIYKLWVEIEGELEPSDTLFLDRGLPDSLTFYRVAGMDPNKVLPDCFRYRYASVFMLDRFPYDQDGVRGGNDAYADYCDKWMRRDYKTLGYETIRTPILPPEDRLAFVLERIQRPEL